MHLMLFLLFQLENKCDLISEKMIRKSLPTAPYLSTFQILYSQFFVNIKKIINLKIIQAYLCNFRKYFNIFMKFII